VKKVIVSEVGKDYYVFRYENGDEYKLPRDFDYKVGDEIEITTEEEWHERQSAVQE
jgi:hypothetical protein